VTEYELLIFNQKGLDFLAADGAAFRTTPLYRIIVSGTPLRPEARLFAAQWGILAIEPDRLPLVTLHWLAGRHVPGLDGVDDATQDRMWHDIPNLVSPLQERIVRLASLLAGGGELLGAHRVERALSEYQRRAGDEYWMALEEDDATWLEDRYDGLHCELDLDHVGPSASGSASTLRHSPTYANGL
jgi:hypothetical protein